MISSLLCVIFLWGCSTTGPEHTTAATTLAETESGTEQTTQQTLPPDPIEQILDSMTLEEMVGQLFLARYPGKDTAAALIRDMHIGSFLLFSKDFENSTISAMQLELSQLQALSGIPRIFAVDEEGGSVNRISIHNQYRSSAFPSPRKLLNDGGLPLLLSTEREKCQLLYSLGIRVNLSPVCDISTKKTAFMYNRSLRQSPEETGRIVSEILNTMQQEQIGGVMKHFPGYGNNEDTHKGTATDDRSLQELEQSDLIPFSMGISAGCGAILVSHTVISCLDSSLPASLSPSVISYLRDKMDFEGVIITDDLKMDAISDRYSIEEAAVMAVLAGSDLLCSSDPIMQSRAVLKAVNEGRIPVERIREAAGRVLRWKDNIGLNIDE